MGVARSGLDKPGFVDRLAGHSDAGPVDPRKREVGAAPGPRRSDKAAARSFADEGKHKHAARDWKGSAPL